MNARLWGQRIWLAGAACVVLAILGFYAGRLFMPLPIFASDEAAYLIRALYPDAVVARNPFVSPVNVGVHLSVIRAVYALGAPLVVGDRIANAAAYLGGLALLWQASTARLPSIDRLTFALIAFGYPYYRFAVSNLAEGLYVGVIVLICLVTARWYRSRPLIHAVLAGALGAALVLVKPNGVAVLAALAVVAGLEAAVCGGWRRLPLRTLIFGMAFFLVGNLIQIGADESAGHPLAFFVGDIYSAQLDSGLLEGALGLGALSLAAMVSSVAILAGTPILVGFVDLIGRWRRARGRFEPKGTDFTFLILALALAATVVMVALFAMKVASTPSETRRLWGRYFEFFVPLLWLAAAPALAQAIGRRTAWSCAAVTAAGLVGLLACFHAGVVLFPWDSSLLTAFFHPDPARAPVEFAIPYRALAVLVTLAAAGALALRLRAAQAGLGLVLALGGLSVWLDHAWLGPMVAQHNALERDIRVIRPSLPAGDIVLLAPDANDGHLGFLRLDARPRVYLGAPSQTAPDELTGAQAVVISGPEWPAGGPWVRTYRGETLSLFRPAGVR